MRLIFLYLFTYLWRLLMRKFSVHKFCPIISWECNSFSTSLKAFKKVINPFLPHFVCFSSICLHRRELSEVPHGHGTGVPQRPTHVPVYFLNFSTTLLFSSPLSPFIEEVHTTHQGFGRLRQSNCFPLSLIAAWSQLSWVCWINYQSTFHSQETNSCLLLLVIYLLAFEIFCPCGFVPFSKSQWSFTRE